MISARDITGVASHGKHTRGLEYVPVLSRGGGLKITIRCVPFKEMVNKYKFGTSNCKINKIT